MAHDSDAGWAVVEHTADVGLRVWGSTPEQLFESAGRGLVQLMTDPDRVHPAETREIVLDGIDLEEALIAWLQEMVYRFEVERFIACDVEIDAIDIPRVSGRIRGETFDPARHETRMDIKAATYHDLEIRRTESRTGAIRWETVVIFDI